MAAAASVVVFDLDDTLAPSKTRLDPTMAELLADLTEVVEVSIISGARFEQFEQQVLAALPERTRLDRLHLMPTCGTRYYRAGDGGWAQVYAEDLTDDETSRVAEVLETAARDLGLWEEDVWGPRVENRGSQVTFSALGQEAPVDAKHAWDPGGLKREALRARAAGQLPGLEVRSGGSTSIDVTRDGIDKAYGIGKLVEHLGVGLDELLFVGDRLDEGGNDYPVKALGVRCIAVERWEDTAEVVRRFLDEARDA